MGILKRTLYLQAAVTGLAGVGLAIAPRALVVSLFDQVAYPEYAFIRFTGALSIGLALLMVLVAHHADGAWWWSWAFVITDFVVAAVAAANVAFGLPGGSSALLWWLVFAANLAFTLALIYGLAATAREHPIQ